MLYNAMIFITAQHGSSACDLACDQLFLNHPNGLQEVQERADTGSGWVFKQSLRQPRCPSAQHAPHSGRNSDGPAGIMVGLEHLRGFYINLSSALMILWSPSCCGPELGNLTSAWVCGLGVPSPASLGPPTINRICFISSMKLDSLHLSLFTTTTVK